MQRSYKRNLKTFMRKSTRNFKTFMRKSTKEHVENKGLNRRN